MRLELTFAEWIGLLTTVGILATFGLSLYIWLRHTRPSRKVKVGFTSTPEGHAQCILVTFVNERGPEVVIDEVGIEYADGVRRAKIPYRPHSSRLPTGVSPRHSARYYITGLRGTIHEREASPVRVYCKDEADHYYKGPKISRRVWLMLSSG